MQICRDKERERGRDREKRKIPFVKFNFLTLPFQTIISLPFLAHYLQITLCEAIEQACNGTYWSCHEPDYRCWHWPVRFDKPGRDQRPTMGSALSLWVLGWPHISWTDCSRLGCRRRRLCWMNTALGWDQCMSRFGTSPDYGPSSDGLLDSKHFM